MSHSKIPLTCIQGDCPNAGEKLYTDIDRCAECHGPLFAWDEVDFVDAPDGDVTWPEGEDIDAARIRSQILFDQAIADGRAETRGRLSEGYRGVHDLAPATPTVREERQNLKLLPSPVQNGSFTCPSDLTGCPIAQKPKVKIPYQLFRKWIWLANEFDTEWIAYLLGHQEEDGTVIVTDHYFPKQRATPAHCEAEDGEVLPGTIAAVHSHVGMQVFFSGEDQAHFNWPIELVINRRGEVKANGRTKLECGRFHRGDADVVLEYQKDDPDFALREELKRQLTREKPPQFQSYPPQTSTSGQPQQGSLWHSSNGKASDKDTRTPEDRRKESEALAALFAGPGMG